MVFVGQFQLDRFHSGASPAQGLSFRGASDERSNSTASTPCFLQLSTFQDSSEASTAARKVGRIKDPRTIMWESPTYLHPTYGGLRIRGQTMAGRMQFPNAFVKPVPVVKLPTGLHSSSFLGLLYRILNISYKQELLWSPMGS